MTVYLLGAAAIWAAATLTQGIWLAVKEQRLRRHTHAAVRAYDPNWNRRHD